MTLLRSHKPSFDPSWPPPTRYRSRKSQSQVIGPLCLFPDWSPLMRFRNRKSQRIYAPLSISHPFLWCDIAIASLRYRNLPFYHNLPFSAYDCSTANLKFYRKTHFYWKSHVLPLIHRYHKSLHFRIITITHIYRFMTLSPLPTRYSDRPSTIRSNSCIQRFVL